MKISNPILNVLPVFLCVLYVANVTIPSSNFISMICAAACALCRAEHAQLLDQILHAGYHMSHVHWTEPHGLELDIYIFWTPCPDTTCRAWHVAHYWITCENRATIGSCGTSGLLLDPVILSYKCCGGTQQVSSHNNFFVLAVRSEIDRLGHFPTCVLTRGLDRTDRIMCYTAHGHGTCQSPVIKSTMKKFPLAQNKNYLFTSTTFLGGLKPHANLQNSRTATTLLREE